MGPQRAPVVERRSPVQQDVVREGRRVSRRAGAGERRKKTEENADALEVVSSSPSLSLPLDSRRSSRERELIFAASAREGDAHA